MWASASQITLVIWVRVRVTGDANITRVLGMGMPISTWQLHFRNEKGTGVDPQLFVGSLLGTRRSAIGQFFPVPSNSPRNLCESLFVPSSLFFLKSHEIYREVFQHLSMRLNKYLVNTVNNKECERSAVSHLGQARSALLALPPCAQYSVFIAAILFV